MPLRGSLIDIILSFTPTGRDLRSLTKEFVYFKAYSHFATLAFLAGPEKCIATATFGPLTLAWESSLAQDSDVNVISGELLSHEGCPSLRSRSWFAIQESSNVPCSDGKGYVSRWGFFRLATHRQFLHVSTAKLNARQPRQADRVSVRWAMFRPPFLGPSPLGGSSATPKEGCLSPGLLPRPTPISPE